MLALSAIDGVVLFGTFIASIVSGLSGFAFTLIAFGFWLHVLPPSEAAPLSLLLGIVSQAYTTWRLRRGIRLDLLWPFVVGGLLGVPIGVPLLRIADPSHFRLGVGLLLVAYSLFMLLRPALAPVKLGGRAADAAIGAVGGVLASAAGLTGAVPTMWCQVRGWPKCDQRGVYQPFILVIHSFAMIALGSGVMLTGAVLHDFTLSVPVMVVGTGLGLALYGRLNDAQFRRIILWLLLASGVLLAVAR
jgi:uncharacterized membrane protein YfcA